MPLPVSNYRQQHQADCLQACIAMVLSYLLIPFHYPRLLQTLQTDNQGTPFFRIQELQSLGISVTRGEGSLGILQSHLEIGLPIIVAVYTGELSYWQSRTDLDIEERETDHAVVVIDIDDEYVYVNDPDFDHAPQIVELTEFFLAWQEHDYRYAIIDLEPPQ